jgi:ArsR family transcriptional regulator, lead/cadmium/zinc/bismuth-responsive transcriptional repressor
MGFATSVYTHGLNRLAFGILDNKQSFVYGKTAVYVARGPNDKAEGPFAAPADSLVVDKAFRSERPSGFEPSPGYSPSTGLGGSPHGWKARSGSTNSAAPSKRRSIEHTALGRFVRHAAVGSDVRTSVRMNSMAWDPERCELLCLDLPKAEALRHSLPSAERLEAAAESAKALADPTRLQAAMALAATDELCVCDLAWVCERSDKLVSHHLRVLRAGGLVQSGRVGKMVLYSLTDAGRERLSVLLVAVEEVSA